MKSYAWVASTATELAAKANECCHRSDGYEEELYELILNALIEAMEH